MRKDSMAELKMGEFGFSKYGEAIYNPTFAADKGRFPLLTWGNGPCRA